jgi:hypothetical protein
VFDYFNALFGGRLGFACGHDPAHVCNMPACPAGSESLYTFTEHNGAWVDAAVFCNSSRPSIQLPMQVSVPVRVAVAVAVVVQEPLPASPLIAIRFIFHIGWQPRKLAKICLPQPLQRSIWLHGSIMTLDQAGPNNRLPGNACRRHST